MHDDKTWKASKRGPNKIPRPPSVPTPCHKCPKIPKDAKPCPENAITLSTKNEQAFWHYYQCQQDRGGLIHQDETTVRNNAMIGIAIDANRRNQQEQLSALMIALATKR